MNDETSAGLLVERVLVPAWETDLLLDRVEQADLVFLPRGVRGGIGEYRDADLPAIEALRGAGVNVNWAHPASERTFASEYGVEVAVAFGLFVAQALGEASVVEVARWLLARIRDALATRPPGAQAVPFVVEVDRLKVNGNRREIEGLRVIGGSDPVAFVDAVASLLRGDPPPK